MTPNRIQTLLVTADQQWPSSLSGSLRQKGFAPLIIAETGARAIDLFYEVDPHLVLLDLELTDCSTIDLCIEMLHAQPGVKIVLVAEKEEHLALVALHAGVVGCIDRNFPVAEWPGVLAYVLSGGTAFSRATLEALLAQTWTVQKREPLLSIGPLRIDLARHLVLYAGRLVQLTPREFALLVCLARKMDHVVSVDQLLNEAWGYGTDDGTPAQVRLYITRLRRKLTDDAQLPDFILTERGVGYRLHSGLLRRAGLRAEPHTHNGNAHHPLHAIPWLPWSHFAPQRTKTASVALKSTQVAEQIKTPHSGWADHAPLHTLDEQGGLLLEQTQWLEPLWLHLIERLHSTHEFWLPFMADLLPRALPAL